MILGVKEKIYDIWIYDMMCPGKSNIETRKNKKRTKDRQLAFGLHERRPCYVSNIVPHIIGALAEGVIETKEISVTVTVLEHATT